ncbi:MAG: shikimate dehydrogenase [Caulobacterales bacterium]|jgi:shikimate dehydrogenase
MSAPQVFAVLGDPVSQSLSPAMHNGWYLDHRINAAYVALRIRAADSAAAFPLLRAMGLSGVNVTAPFKELAASVSDVLEPAMQTLRAANVLAFDDDGTTAAFNTDAPGFILSLEDGAPGWRERTRHALVIGAGGAGRAIAYGLRQAGVETITLVNRDVAKAQAFASAIGAQALGLDDLEAGFAQADLIVNATSLGMGGGVAVWPVGVVAPHAIVADAVYAPLETGLLAAARARGLAVVDGLGMLIGQGALAFQLWFGVLPDRAIARERLMRILAERGG